MLSKRRITDIMRNADDKAVEKITEAYPQADRDKMEDMYSRVEKHMNEGNNVYGEEVRGVEKYRRRSAWKTVPAAIVCIAVAGGAIGGGAALIRHNNGTSAQTDVSADTSEYEEMLSEEEEKLSEDIRKTEEEYERSLTEVTEVPEEAPVTEAFVPEEISEEEQRPIEAVQSEIEENVSEMSGEADYSKQEIYDLCCSADRFDNVSYSRTIDTYRSTIAYDDTLGVLSIYDAIVPGSESMLTKEAHDYYYKGNAISFMICPEDSSQNDLVCISPERDCVFYGSAMAEDYLSDFDSWEVTGVLNDAVIIEGTGGPYENVSSFRIAVDPENGTTLKATLNFNNFSLELDDFAYGDDAEKPMTPSEFKAFIKENESEGLYDIDISFLDE